MAPISMTLSDLECHFSCYWTFLTPIHEWIWYVLTTLSVYMDGKYLWSLIATVFQKWQTFRGIGALQAVTYTLKVVVSKKWREIDALLFVRPYTSRIGSIIWSIYSCHFQWPWMTLTVICLMLDSGLRPIKCNSTNICATFSTALTVTARRAIPRR